MPGLILAFRAVDVGTMDERGFNRQAAQHWGLVRSVLVSVEHLMASTAFTDADKDGARRLLACLCMLPHTTVPMSLLTDTGRVGDGGDDNGTAAGSREVGDTAIVRGLAKAVGLGGNGSGGVVHARQDLQWALELQAAAGARRRGRPRASWRRTG